MNFNKVGLIISREYITRVKKKSFIIMTFLGPLLMASIIFIPILVMQFNDDGKKTIAVVDEFGLLENAFIDNESTDYEYYTEFSKTEELLNKLNESDYYAVLTINDSLATSSELVAKEQVSLTTKMRISSDIKEQVQQIRMLELGISQEDLDAITPNVDILTSVWKEGKKEESSTEIAMVVGIIMGMIIYMVTFIYGSLVMRGVIDDSNGFTDEIMISSVKPFELMMGKVLGVAMVALTQFIAWIIITVAIVGVGQNFIPGLDTANMVELQASSINSSAEIQGVVSDINPKMLRIVESVNNLPVVELIAAFLFFFVGGYLLYSSLFAAIGAAVDNETDSQQFILPITMPLILAMVMLQAIIDNPHGTIAYWFSIIPFTSPIVMLMRIPFGVPMIDLIISGTLLILTFIGTIWLASKIYRVGILMYGKKVSYKELWKWIRYH
ncbi:MAG: ABC transporter permease [Bacteroidales bacterium]|nr:ABC transporter permease [Bacteroidales bacterium]